MLRITTEGDPPTVRLEGELVGPWVAACREACSRASTARGAVSLDLTRVRYADAEGVELLRGLARAGHALETSRFVRALLETEDER